MDVLRALEETAWHIKPEDIEEINRKENWRFWQDANPEAFTGNHEISDDTFFRLTNNFHRVKKIAKTLQALLDTASDIEDQFETALRRRPKPIIEKQSKGITSLPDDVLGRLFTSSVSPGERKQAIRLSHVSRYFRAIALGECTLWTTIHSSSLPDELDTFLARSGQDSGLHIVVYINAELWLPSFLEKCRPLAGRWKSLTVIDSIGVYSIHQSQSINEVLRMIDGDTQQHLGRLETLRFRDKESSHLMSRTTHNLADEGDRFRPLWTSPLLRDLHFSDYVPSPAPGAFSSVTSLTFSIKLRRYNYRPVLTNLLSFLAGTPSITDLTLGIHDVDNALDYQGLEHFQFPNPALCPSITSLSLHFAGFTVGERENRMVAAITRPLSFFNLEQLSIWVEFRHAEFMHANLHGDVGFNLLRDLSKAFLPGSYAGPHLVSISYKLTLGARRSNDVVGNINVPRRIFMIPFDRIPNLSSVTLTTFTRVIFYREVTFEPYHLRELHLRECNELDGGYLQEIIESLKGTRAWNTVESVTVQACKKLQYETTLDAVGAERLRFFEP